MVLEIVDVGDWASPDGFSLIAFPQTLAFSAAFYVALSRYVRLQKVVGILIDVLISKKKRGQFP